MIVRVSVVLKLRTVVVVDTDRRFDNLSESHLQSHVNCQSSVDNIYIYIRLTTSTRGVASL